MTRRHISEFTGIEPLSFDEAYAQFLSKIKEYELEVQMVAAAINVANTWNILELTQDQKLAVMIECRDVVVEAEWVLGIDADKERTDELHS